ncbi:MAG: PIN domain-containing protein [Clostridiales bacterium]|nr:PIN domain-containing protein [Clostridiales bacterium]
MRVAVDANVLVSALAFPHSVSARALAEVLEHHVLVLPAYVADEVTRILARRFPKALEAWEAFLETGGFERVPADVGRTLEALPTLRDPKDLPVLAAILVAKPDVFLTGDRDFRTPEVEGKLTVFSPGEFLTKLPLR